MDKEKILLDALNTFGNFTSVEQEFNYNQLEVIYEAMDKVLYIAPIVGRSEQLSCGRNITTCVFYKEGGKCSNLEYCRDQTT